MLSLVGVSRTSQETIVHAFCCYSRYTITLNTNRTKPYISDFQTSIIFFEGGSLRQGAGEGDGTALEVRRGIKIVPGRHGFGTNYSSQRRKSSAAVSIPAPSPTVSLRKQPPYA